MNTDDDSSALLSALRGKGMPLSYRIDREAVEWSFSYLLDYHPNHSCDSLVSFTDLISSAITDDSDVRVSVLFELTDPYSEKLILGILLLTEP